MTSPPEIVIRTARSDDREAIDRLARQLGDRRNPQSIRSALEHIRRDPDQEILVAEDAAGNVVGWAHLFRADRVQTDPFAEIGGLAVDERLRGTGIGRRLLATAEDWASSRGLEQLRIRSRRDRDSAHAAFASMGFVLSKTQRVFTRTRRAEAVLLKNKRIADSGRERYIDERKEGE